MSVINKVDLLNRANIKHEIYSPDFDKVEIVIGTRRDVQTIPTLYLCAADHRRGIRWTATVVLCIQCTVCSPITMPSGSRCNIQAGDVSTDPTCPMYNTGCTPLWAPSVPPQPICDHLMLPRHPRALLCYSNVCACVCAHIKIVQVTILADTCSSWATTCVGNAYPAHAPIIPA
jgi:hypothetical protein